MIEIIRNPHIDFISRRKYGFIFSTIITVMALLLILIKGPNFGIDFTGGALLQVRFEKPINTAALRGSLAKIGKENAQIQALGVTTSEYVIRAAGEDPAGFASSVKEILQTDFPDNEKEFLREETVEPKIGKFVCKGLNGFHLKPKQPAIKKPADGAVHIIRIGLYGRVQAGVE